VESAVRWRVPRLALDMGRGHLIDFHYILGSKPFCSPPVVCAGWACFFFRAPGGALGDAALAQHVATLIATPARANRPAFYSVAATVASPRLSPRRGIAAGPIFEAAPGDSSCWVLGRPGCSKLRAPTKNATSGRPTGQGGHSLGLPPRPRVAGSQGGSDGGGRDRRPSWVGDRLRVRPGRARRFPVTAAVIGGQRPGRRIYHPTAKPMPPVTKGIRRPKVIAGTVHRTPAFRMTAEKFRADTNAGATIREMVAKPQRQPRRSNQRLADVLRAGSAGGWCSFRPARPAIAWLGRCGEPSACPSRTA